MIYLASPYTHPDPEVRQKRHDQVCQLAAYYINEGESIFCPIAMSCAIHQYLPQEQYRSFEGWEKLDLDILAHCERLIVAELNGWTLSKGVQTEIEYAVENDIDIEFVSAQDIYELIGVEV